MNDNLARVLVSPEYEDLRRIEIERANRKAKARKNSTIRSVLAVALIFVLAFTLISANMKVNELELTISENEERLSILKNANEQKTVTLESAMTLEEIELQAKTRLGMNKPANNQIVYISIPKADIAYVAN